MAELPPVSGPTNAMRTVSLAVAARENVTLSAAAASLMAPPRKWGARRCPEQHMSCCVLPSGPDPGDRCAPCARSFGIRFRRRFLMLERPADLVALPLPTLFAAGRARPK